MIIQKQPLNLLGLELIIASLNYSISALCTCPLIYSSTACFVLFFCFKPAWVSSEHEIYINVTSMLARLCGLEHQWKMINILADACTYTPQAVLLHHHKGQMILQF
ncbi:hypothetical protein M758_4G029100 [Ceratodon purpureus]|nr:hypothetical protein M758_4G029100 [Ceratodon purpureus]